MSDFTKNKTTVAIGGRDYTIVSPEETAYIQSIAIELNERIKELSDSFFSLSTLDITTLAALNLMDEYTKTKEELERVSSEVDGLRTALRDMQLKLRNENERYTENRSSYLYRSSLDR